MFDRKNISIIISIIGIIAIVIIAYYFSNGPVTTLGKAPDIASSTQKTGQLSSTEQKSVETFRERIVRRARSSVPFTSEEKAEVATILITNHLYQFSEEERTLINEKFKNK